MLLNDKPNPLDFGDSGIFKAFPLVWNYVIPMLFESPALAFGTAAVLQKKHFGFTQNPSCYHRLYFQ